MIIQARKVFASENSRKQYDIELAKSNREPVDPQEERYSELYKWQEQAMSYYNTGQYDLAKVAIDKALSCNGLDDNDALFCLTADIYRESGNNSAAMEYINKATLLLIIKCEDSSCLLAFLAFRLSKMGLYTLSVPIQMNFDHKNKAGILRP